MPVSFDVTREETKLIAKIVERAEKMWNEHRPDEEPLNRLNLHMDISACIANGCPLKLQSLLDADDFNFSHDVFGIDRHMNRMTGKLMNCFLPRFHNIPREAQS